jgi:hypothetical protein
MKASRTVRRLVPWILGLYLVAQAAGIASLAALHLDHIHQSQAAIADDIARTGVVDHSHEHNGHHQHGTPDLADPCCTVHHHLAAVLPPAPAAQARAFVSATLALPLPDHLSGAEPGRLDRPPKLPLSV